MSAATILLRPGPRIFVGVLEDVHDDLKRAERRLGPAPRGTLRKVAGIALHSARHGAALPVNLLNSYGQLMEDEAPAPARTGWTLDGANWAEVARQAQDALLDGAAWAQVMGVQEAKESAAVLEHCGAGADLLSACYEIESKGGRQHH